MTEKPVEYSDEKVVIPTYEMGSDDPYPPYFTDITVGAGYIYPYALQDNLGHVLKDKTYRALVLENKYLKVTVLPELGGHVYSMYDKTLKKELLYTNDCMKPALVSVRGAWCAFGIEHNFPRSHNVTSLSKVTCNAVFHKDGSKSIIVGDTDRITGMKWIVEITLYKDKSYLKLENKILNNTPFPHPYYYWTNTAIPLTPQTQYIFPESMKHAFKHGSIDVNDLVVFPWPIYKGNDLSWNKNIHMRYSLFAYMLSDDFFGLYHHNLDHGIIHVADHKKVPGRKIWSWGVTEDADLRTSTLTDKSGQYCEVQCGPIETQGEFRFLKPFTHDSWNQYWYAPKKMKGFRFANENAAVNIIRKGTSKIELYVNTTFDMKDGRLALFVAGKTIFKRTYRITPFKPFAAVINIPKKCGNEDFVFSIKMPSGAEVIRYNFSLTGRAK
ncbi:MAG: hypothetical protein A2252_11705 [Elusimicrobia bacterium RIFOXYA2_FULL_39_19]|nr:MAG: hypothetical protein A2252_11705 [Elusimicrobia bacterium RIFOXYA2_FULL_39_19]